MKLLYLIKGDPDDTIKKVMEVQSRGNEVAVVDLRVDMDYGKTVALMESSDKVISW